MILTQDTLKQLLAERDVLRVQVATLKGQLRDAQQTVDKLRQRQRPAAPSRPPAPARRTAPYRPHKRDDVLREENRELRRMLRVAARTGRAPQIP